MSYTPSSVFASLGLLQNTGMDLSNITGKVTSYESSPSAAAFKTCVTLAQATDTAYGIAVNAPAVLLIGGSQLPGMLGSMPAAAAVDLAAAGYTGTLADASIGQAQAIFPSGDISSFVQNFGKSAGAASVSNDLLQATKVLSGKSWSDFGPGISKISDIATGGFSQLSQGTGISLKNLGAQLSKLGATENLADLTRAKTALNEGSNVLTSVTGQPLSGSLDIPDGVSLAEAQADQIAADFKNGAGNAVNVAVNLLNQGAGTIGDLSNKLQSVGLPTSPDLLIEFASNKFAVDKVTVKLITIDAPADITKLKVALSMDSSVVMNNAGDLLDPIKLVPDMKDTLDVNIYSQLPKLLNGLPGGDSIQTPGDLGDMLSEFEDVPDTAALDEMESFVDASMVADLEDALPEADDPSVGITTADLIGVVSGGPIGELMETAKLANDQLATSTQGLAILSLLSQLQADFIAAGSGDWTVTPMPSGKSIADYRTLIEAQMTSISTSGNIGLLALASDVGEKFSSAATKLAKQIAGLGKMDIDLTAVNTGTLMPLIGFGRSLADLAKKPGNEQMLVNMCSDSDVGQALKLHITEKKNLAIMQKFGITPPNEFKF